jgi:hypothetical protein
MSYIVGKLYKPTGSFYVYTTNENDTINKTGFILINPADYVLFVTSKPDFYVVNYKYYYFLSSRLGMIKVCFTEKTTGTEFFIEVK